MEQLQETYEAGGFVFRTKKEAELAQREIEGTKYLRQKLDMENPNAVFSIYQNLIEQDLFETPVGYCFLKELRDYLLMIPRNADSSERHPEGRKSSATDVRTKYRCSPSNCRWKNILT